MTGKYAHIVSKLMNTPLYADMGDEVRYECPFCHSNKNKFYISNKLGIYNCYNCGKSGTIAKLAHLLYHIPYSEAYESLFKDVIEENDLVELDDKTLYSAIIDLKTKDDVSSIKKSLKMPPLPSNCYRLLDNMNNTDAFPYFNYLNDRGVSYQDIVDSDIHYVVRGATKTSKGKTLFITNSVVFITHWDGKPVYWNTRSIERNPFLKTFNASATDDEYSRNDVIFNLDKANGQNIVLCEGVFNALTVSNNTNLGLATFGKEVSDNQVNILRRNSSRYKRIYLFLDNDAKNRELELADRLINAGLSTDRIFVVDNPYGDKDANDLGKDICNKLISNAHQYSLTDNLVHLFD